MILVFVEVNIVAMEDELKKLLTDWGVDPIYVDKLEGEYRSYCRRKV